MPKMIKYKKYQKMEKSKYEVRVSYDKDHTLAAASLNLHGTAFTSPFHIKVKGVDNPVSGCVGFGIERWILIFLNLIFISYDVFSQLIINYYD